MRRRTVATVTVVALMPGVALIGLALAADPLPSTVGITADAVSTPSVTPSVIAVSPGALLQFSLSPSGAAVRIVRASPPLLDYSLDPGGTTSPSPITISPTELVYSVYAYSPAALGGIVPESDGPTQTAEVLVTPTVPPTATPSAPGTTTAGTGTPSLAQPTFPVASVMTSPSPTTRRTSARPSTSSSPRASSRPTATKTPSRRATSSPKPAATSSAPPAVIPPAVIPPAETVGPPGVLMLPSTVARFTASPGSSPQIYDPHASAPPVAAGATTPPAVGSPAPASAPPATVLAADVPVTGIAGQRVEARERGLPVAVAAVLLLGVGGAVGRAVTAVQRGRGRRRRGDGLD